MRIGVTIDEVLRDFIGQLIHTYEKYINTVDIDENDVKSFDLLNYFKFNNIEAMNDFIYKEAALEIFGHADQMSPNLMNHFNSFITDIIDEEEHEIKIISREADKSIPSTFFFLSKLGCRISKVEFVTKYENMWDNVDILITATPKALETKPNNKISIKINSSYNTDIESDYEYNGLIDLINDEDGYNKIIKTTKQK